MERSKYPRPFEASAVSNKLVLTAANELNDRHWGAWFGKIQEALRQLEWDGHKFNECLVDLRECTWSDPLPLLSLAVGLAEFRDRGGTTVNLHLPSPDNQTKSDTNRILQFLSREGFIDLFWEATNQASAKRNLSLGPFENGNKTNVLTTIKDSGASLTRTALSGYMDLPANLVFNDSTCLPARLLFLRSLDAEEGEKIDRWVDEAMESSIDSVIMDKVPKWAQRGLTYRVRMFLREALHNVAEHAYGGDQSGYVAVYVRYRNGLLGISPSVWRLREIGLNREKNTHHVPVLHPDFARNRTGFFEVFVVDAGVGMCQTLGLCSFNHHHASDPLHKAMLAVFKEGKRNQNKRQSHLITQFGGIHLLAQLFELNHDYVRVRDWDTWFGATVPLPDAHGTQGQHTLSAEGDQHCKTPINGVAWTVRLSWPEKTDIPGFNQPWRGLGNQKDIQRLLNELSHEGSNFSFSKTVPIQDNRFYTKRWSNLAPWNEKPVPYALLLPQPDCMRDRIQNEILNILKSGCLLSSGTLIIGEIDPIEAFTYLEAIEGAYKFQDERLLQVDHVVMVTKELHCCFLSREKTGKKLLRSNEYATGRFINGRNRSLFAPDTCLSDYFKVLRHHDAYRISLEIGLDKPEDDVFGNRTSNSLVREFVTWSNKLILWSGYLDFPQTLTY